MSHLSRTVLTSELNSDSGSSNGSSLLWEAACNDGICCPPAGRGGTWAAPGPGPRSGRSREEQHVAGFDAGTVGGEERMLPANSRLQLHEPQRARLPAGLPGE